MKFIFTADWHLRPDRPRCRIDEDWIVAQAAFISNVANEAIKRDVPLVIGGDIFHRSQVPDLIKNIFITGLQRVKVYAIAGQHDEPYHSFSNIQSSSFGVLLSSGTIALPSDFGRYINFGCEVKGSDTGLLFIHELIFPSIKDMPPNVKAFTASQILDQYPDAQWILSGDNHHGFHYEKDGRHVVMAGCLNRQAVDMKDYSPVIWYIDTDNNVAEPISTGDSASLITDEYLVQTEEKNNRITAFVETIKDAKTTSLDFMQNVEQTAIQHNIDHSVMSVVDELLEEVK